MLPAIFRTCRNAVLLTAAASLFCSPFPVQAQARPLPSKLDETGSFAAIVAEVLPATVMINTFGGYVGSESGSSEPNPAQPGPPSLDVTNTMASGFIIDPDGLVVTNAHVVAGAGAISVSLNDGRSFSGTLIGMDEHTDLALVKIASTRPLPSVSWGDPQTLKPGHRIVVLGNPLGLGLSATDGIIAGLNRDLLTGPYDRFIQIDASVATGDSGGPLLDTSGNVVGVTTAMMSWCEGCTGMGFAVPADLAMSVIGQLLEYGHVPRGFIGVQTQPLTDRLASLSDADGLDGELITRIQPGSPAESAGLQLGDIVLAVDGMPVTAAQGLLDLISRSPEGGVAQLTLWRNGAGANLAVRIARAPDGMAALESSREAEFSLYGLDLTAVPIDDETRHELAVPADENGWLLVWTGGADMPGSLAPGDVITHLDGMPVPDLASFRAAASRLAAGPKNAVLARIWRNGSALFVPVWNAADERALQTGAPKSK